MAVSHVVSHARRPLQGPVAIRIIAVRLRARGLQEMLIHLVGLIVQTHHIHLMGNSAHLKGKSAPHVLAFQLERGRTPGIGPARRPAVAPAWEGPRPGEMAEQPSPPGMSDSLTSCMSFIPGGGLAMFAGHLANTLEVLGRQFPGELPGGFARCRPSLRRHRVPESGSVRSPDREHET